MRLAIPVGRIDTGSLLIAVGAFYIASHLVFVRGIFKYTTLFTWVAFDIVDCKGLLCCVILILAKEATKCYNEKYPNLNGWFS